MITKSEAITIGRSHLPEDWDVLPGSILEKDYGWYMVGQTRRYIESGNSMDFAFGGGGFLVEKSSGRCIEFSSGLSLETNFKIYELGYFAPGEWKLMGVRAFWRR